METNYLFRLYVAGTTPRSLQVIGKLKTILEEELKGLYTLEVIDIIENPHLAKENQIIATPTLERSLPQPVRRIIADLSYKGSVLAALDSLRREIEQTQLWAERTADGC